MNCLSRQLHPVRLREHYAVQDFAMRNLVQNYINSYWASEHGGMVFTRMHGCEEQVLRPDAHTFALPWVVATVMVETETTTGATEFKPAPRGENGDIILMAPYPYLARGCWGDAAHYGQPGWRGDRAGGPAGGIAAVVLVPR